MNIVVIVVDRLQAGLIGAYGNAWIRTPEIDRLAATGFVFDQAFAGETSVAGTLRNCWEHPSDASGSWVSTLADHGIRSTLVTDDPEVNKHPLAAAFNERSFVELSKTAKRVAAEIEDTQLARFFASAAERIENQSDSSLLWLHTRGLALPWDAPFELRAQYAEEDDPMPPAFTSPPNLRLPPDYDPDELLGITQAYSGQVALLDTCIGALLDCIDESPHAASTLVVLVGARGFPLGEHGRVGECDAALYEELTHVPMIVRLPNGVGALARSSALATHRDIGELLLGWLDARSSRTLALIRGEQSPWRKYLRLHSTSDRGIRTPAWYLREAVEQKPELYLKPDDRWEINDVADRCPEIVNQLTDVLASAIQPDSPLPEILTASHD